MLAGMLPPTSGDAIVAGYSITTQLEKARNSLGLWCVPQSATQQVSETKLWFGSPQHDVLFGHLTVSEHLWLYGVLKGTTSL